MTSNIRNQVELEMIAAGSYAMAVIEPCEKTVEARRLLRNALQAMVERYGTPAYLENVPPVIEGSPRPVFVPPRLVKA